MTKAVVLLSGGLDSSTALAVAAQDHEVYALTLSYGQLHRCELQAAQKVAAAVGAKEHKVLDLPLSEVAKSALTTDSIAVPKDRAVEDIAKHEIPATYVPARNTIFLGLAGAWAESIGATDIYIGVNVLDASGYPDCTREFIRAFESALNIGTSGAGGRLRLVTPLIDLTKAEIIELGLSVGVDYGMTHSCYSPTGDLACRRCDACILRIKGFEEAGVPDPTRYVS